MSRPSWIQPPVTGQFTFFVTADDGLRLWIDNQLIIDFWIDQGATDRGVYWVESGSLSVHYEDDKGRLRMALVGAGGLLGEGAFFSHRPRSATVQAGSACRLWGLTPLRFTELSNRQPAIALALTLAMGGVLSKRMANRRRRVAAT